jgi:hypothetical protein
MGAAMTTLAGVARVLCLMGGRLGSQMRYLNEAWERADRFLRRI